MYGLLALAACSGGDSREQMVVGALVKADLSNLRQRPSLMAGKLARMAGDEYAFFRGYLPVFARDWADAATHIARSRFFVDRPLVLALGDPHPENFGALVDTADTLTLEPNDFDSADLLPFLWDVRRLAVGIGLSARLASGEALPDREARAVRAGLTAYVETLRQGARGFAVPVPDSAVVKDVLRRSRKDFDSRDELAQLTDVAGRDRVFRRDAEHLDPGAAATSQFETLIDAWRRTLHVPLAPSEAVLLDAVRVLGSGVSSFARMRWLLLLRGPSDADDDDLIVEVKELGDAPMPSRPAPGSFFASAEERVATVSQAAWSTPARDPLWSTTAWLGFPVQLRSEREGYKGLKVSRLTGELSTDVAVDALSEALFTRLAQVHATPTSQSEAPADSLWAVLSSDPAGFVDEQTAQAAASLTQLEVDWDLFRAALAHRGPTLGVRPDPEDAPDVSQRQLLFGVAP